MRKAILFTDAPVHNVCWSTPMDPNSWDQEVGVVKATTCLNRFEVLIQGDNIEAEDVREWAHRCLDAWLDKR